MKQTYRCWAEIDLDALRANLAWIRHHVGPAVRIVTVVKADAYGHGLKQIAATLMQSGTDVFGVANLAEARAVRSVGSGWPILMLGACLPAEAENAVRDDIIVTVSSSEELDRFSEASRRLGKIAHVHLKVDTGMGRLGTRPQDVAALVEQASRLPEIQLDGLWTHFASAESDARFTARQRRLFESVLLSMSGRRFEFVHASNSAGVLFEPRARFNCVRPGLLVYGVIPVGSRRVRQSIRRGFRPVLAWKCRIGLVKEIPAGTSLSYGRSFVAPRRMRVATLTAGYGDGYLRSGSTRARVLIGGKHCTVLGRITMDQMLADIGHVPDVKAGDEVVLVGRQGADEISVAEVAEWCGTIPCEVLTAITYRVPRIYRGSHAA